jgi:hypothetical protein
MGAPMVRKAKVLQVKVRMSVELHNRIDRDAARQGQTINAEILRRLEQSYEIGDQLSSAIEKLDELATASRARTAKMQAMQARKEFKP